MNFGPREGPDWTLPQSDRYDANASPRYVARWAVNAIEVLAQTITTFMANRRMATQPIGAIRRALKKEEVQEAFNAARNNYEQALLVTAAAEAAGERTSHPGHAVPAEAKRPPGPGAYSQPLRRRAGKAQGKGGKQPQQQSQLPCGSGSP